MNIGFGFHMMELHIRKMVTKHGFIFQWEVSHKENNSPLFSKIWITKPNYMGKVWSQFFVFYRTHKRNGEEYLPKSTTFSIRKINLPLNFLTCLVTSQMRQRILHFQYHSLIRRFKIKWEVFKNYLKKTKKRKTYISIEKPFIILWKEGKWKWWLFLQMKV